MSKATLKNNVIFAGGGTGGHLYPAIAMAQRLEKLDTSLKMHFIGTKRGLEMRVIPELGYPLHVLNVRGFSRKNPFLNIWIILLLFVSFVQSLILILKLKPVVVVGTGGYVSGPVLFLSSLLKIPTLVQEQNSYPGVTTRLLAGHVDQVHLSFKESVKYFKNKSRLQVTGNPVRNFDVSNNRENARVFFNLSPERTTVLIFGGSQGAVAVNDAMLANMHELITKTDAQFIWITGKHSFEQIKTESAKFNGRVHVVEFVDNMNMAYQASNLAVCRAGAIAISELAICGVPAVLIPYPFATADHQTFNAKAYAKAGAAKVIMESDLKKNQDILSRTILELVKQPQTLIEMQKAAREASFPDAVDVLAKAILSIKKKKTGFVDGFLLPRQKNIIF